MALTLYPYLDTIYLWSSAQLSSVDQKTRCFIYWLLQFDCILETYFLSTICCLELQSKLGSVCHFFLSLTKTIVLKLVYWPGKVIFVGFGFLSAYYTFCLLWKAIDFRIGALRVTNWVTFMLFLYDSARQQLNYVCNSINVLSIAIIQGLCYHHFIIFYLKLSFLVEIECKSVNVCAKFVACRYRLGVL